MGEKYSSQTRYHEKAGMVNFTMHIFKKTEQDIINKLETVPSKATYIKKLIRKDIERSKK